MSYRILQVAALAAVLMAATGCQILHKMGTAGMPSIKGTGPSKGEERTVGDFERIDIGGPFKVEVRVGPNASLKVEAQENILKAIRSEVKNGTLQVWTENSFESTEPLKLTITTPRLTALDGSGACIGNLEGVNSDKFMLNLSGASRMHVKGVAKDVTLETSGASEVVWDKLIATRVAVKGSGACTLLLSGSADSIDMDVSGACSLKGEDFVVKNATVMGSGGCELSINASERIDGELSGGTNLRHSGKAQVSVSTNGGASVLYKP